MQFTGKVTLAGLIREGVGKTGTKWSSQQFKMEEDAERYPQSIVFDVMNDKVALSEGETCTVHLEVEVAEYNGKLFNNIRAWKKVGGTVSHPPAPAAPAQQATATPVATAPATATTEEPPF